MSRRYLGYISLPGEKSGNQESFLRKKGAKIAPVNEQWNAIPSDCIRVIKVDELFFGGEVVELVEVARCDKDFHALLKKVSFKKSNDQIEVFDLPKKMIDNVDLRVLSLPF